MMTFNGSNGEMIMTTGGCYDCGGRCLFKVHIKNGKAVKIESDEGEEPQLRACSRGRAFRKQVYAPDRLLFPLKRTGNRGKGEFKRISWDEALETTAAELLRVKNTYGAQSILFHAYSGAHVGFSQGGIPIPQVLNKLGRYTISWGGASCEGSTFASRANYSTLTTVNTRDDLVNSRLIIIWGMNPAVSIFATNSQMYFKQAKESGARCIVIDPIFNDSAAVLADEWIPIKPGTDSALAIAMAHVIISQDLLDVKFLEKYTVGFEQFKDYVMGVEDGIPKTPVWGEAKTGVPANTIIKIAREYATSKPAAILPGFAPGRTAYGEQFVRAASTLAAMTGNIGIHGGSAVGFGRASVGPQFTWSPASDLPGAPYHVQQKALDVADRLRTKIHIAALWDGLIQGKDGGYPADIKLAYFITSNPLNQLPNINKGVKSLEKLEFVVVHDLFMTTTARYADIILPVANHWERSTGVSRPYLFGPYFFYLDKIISAPGEVKTDTEIGRELAKKLGVYDPSTDVTEEEGMMREARAMPDVKEEILDFEKFKNDRIHKIKIEEPEVCFKNEIDDPDKHPFQTPSGKIEIYCQRIADLKHPGLPPVPKHIDTWEGPSDPLIDKYPLQLVTYHHKTRAHSNFVNNDWLSDLEPQGLWVNPFDARKRGIIDGTIARVFNDRGETIIKARVTERIMPGVVALGQGAHYQPDDMGRDRGGNPNILTRDTYSPGGAFPTNTTLVQVESFTGNQ